MGRNRDKLVGPVSRSARCGLYYFIFWGTGPPMVQVAVSKAKAVGG
jgi:hypothetical protein